MSTKPLDRRRPEPLYHQLEVLLRERILSGEWPAGARIPTEEQLIELYGVSRVTVRQALRNLVLDGHLERGQGRGTFVRKPILTAGERGLLSFSQEMRALGLEPGAKVVEHEVITANAAVGVRLELKPGAHVYRLKRLRTGDAQPIGLQTSYLPADRFPGMLELLGEGSSLYETLRSGYGLVMAEARETFSITSIGPDAAGLLDVPSGTSAFHVERLARDQTNRAFEYTVSVMRADRYRISWVLRNPATQIEASQLEGEATI